MKPDKFQSIQKFLYDEYLLLHVDPNTEGVVLPADLMNSPTITLKLSKLFRGKLIVEKTLIEAELLFGEEYFTCMVPLNAIWGITSIKGQTLTWPNTDQQRALCAILELSESQNKQKAARAPAKAHIPQMTKVKAARASHLKRVK